MKNHKCECNSCDWTGDQSEVVPLGEGDRGPWELTPGTEVPAGECPKCGVWAYIVKESEPKSLSGAAPGLLEACKELIENIEGKGAAMTMHELYLLNRWGPTITAAEQPKPAK